MNHAQLAAVHHFPQDLLKLIDTIKTQEDSEEEREPMQSILLPTLDRDKGTITQPNNASSTQAPCQLQLINYNTASM